MLVLFGADKHTVAPRDWVADGDTELDVAVEAGCLQWIGTGTGLGCATGTASGLTKRRNGGASMSGSVRTY